MAECPKRLATPDGTPPRQRTLASPEYSNALLASLRELYQDASLCDYTIIAEGQTFHTHRNVLASVSDYFRAMLTGSMMEARQDHVDLKGVSGHAVQLLLDFAYTGELVLTLEDIMEVLGGACHLQMQAAISLCAHFLSTEISRKTCVDILNIAEMFTLQEVKEKATSYLITHFEKVASTEQFMKLYPGQLCTLLLSDHLFVQSELALFHHIVRWVAFDESGRADKAWELLQHVRFAMMQPEELVDKVSGSPLMSSDSRCRAFLDEALHYHLLPTRQPLMQTPRTQVRNSPCIMAFGGRMGLGFNIGYKHNSNKMFVLRGEQWHQLPNAETNFLYAAAAVVDNFMYVCGGMGKPFHARATCHRYDPRVGTWTRLKHMLVRRQSFPLVGAPGKLYAFGGGMPVDEGIEHPPTNKSEMYSIDKNDWTAIAPLPGNRKSASACEHDGKVYVSGGRTDNETMHTFWCYHPSEDRWEEKADMLLSHAGHAMMSVEDKIYIIDRGTSSVECCCPVADDWSKVSVPFGSFSGVARPIVMGPWVYFLSYVEEDKDYLCRRYNVLTRQTEMLPMYPEKVHCVIGCPLTFPQNTLVVDRNNNP